MVCSFELTNKVIIITGGYGHLGKGIVENLLYNNAVVVVLARNELKYQEVFANILKETRNLNFISCDIEEEFGFEMAYALVQKQFGRIDAIINNAFYTRGQSPENMTSGDFNFGLDGTLTSIYRSIKACIPYMKDQEFGSIVNLSSMYGMVSPNFSLYEDFPNYLNPPHYGAAKAGVIQMTKYYANYLGTYNIRVNAVSPGPFPSKQVQKDGKFIDQLKAKTSLKRIGKPEDLGGVFSFLCSDASLFITGQNIAVDGGWTSI